MASLTHVGRRLASGPIATWLPVLLLCPALTWAAADPAPSVADPTLSFAAFLWALLILLVLVVGGLVWLGIVRRETRRQSGALQRRRQALEAWYRDLFDNAHDVLLSLDLQGRLLTLNQAGRALFGPRLTPDSNPNLLDSVAKADRVPFETLLSSLREGQDSAHGEVELSLPSDRRVTLRLNLRRQSLPGRPTEVHAIAWDVTEQRQAEQALRESEHRLRHSLEERIRIGRDLHDGIIQSIYAVGLGLGECRRLVTEDPGAAERRLEQSRHELNAVIREVRAFIEGLEPAALKGREFRTALEGIAAALDPEGRLTLELEIDSSAANRLTAREASELLQIAREALSNSLRHGGARRVRLTLASGPSQTRLELGDDGRGFDPERASSGGLGLRNMQARAASLGGSCEIRSTPGSGATVVVSLPLRSEPDSTP